jgi:CRISPR-associated protein Csx14
MSYSEPGITVNVDVTNPGQFFACCGLLELTDRLWRGAEGWFGTEDRTFLIKTRGTLTELVDSVANAELIHVQPSDPYSSPLIIGAPFRQLTVDWWESDMTGARDLKVWAGTMESFGIAAAMQHAMRDARFRSPDLFDVGMVVMSPNDAGKKKEPYYFDARRTPNAHSRDVGFAPNDLGMTSIAHPAVELLCLVGLQSARPAFTPEVRVYDYHTWHIPLMPNLLLPASTGALQISAIRAYRFENWFRTGQKKHKAFRTAVSLS